MNKKYQNGFFLFGLVVLIIMASQLDFRQAWQGIQHAGYWFVAVILLWAFLYMINTTSWYLIIDTMLHTVQLLIMRIIPTINDTLMFISFEFPSLYERLFLCTDSF